MPLYEPHIDAVSAGTSSIDYGQIVFSNSNSVSFGLSGQTITASIASGAFTNSSWTASADTRSETISQLVFSNSNGVSFGLTGGTLTATVKTDYQSAGAYLTTAAQSNQVVNSINGSTGIFTFNTGSSLSSSRDANSFTFGLASNITTALQSAGAYLTTAMGSNRGSDFVNVTAGLNLTNISATFNSNAISLSVAAAAGQTNQTVGLYALGNTTQNSSTTLDARTLSFNAIGSITMGYSNGSIQVSAPNALTTAMASNRGSDFVQATAAFAGTNASGTIASGGISISVLAPDAGAAIKGSGTYIHSTGTVEFANSNGITFGLSNNGTMTASHNGLTTAMASNRGSDFVQATAVFNGTNASGTIASGAISVSVAAQSNQNVSLFALGNTTQNSSTVLNASNLSFNAIGSITMGYSNGSIQVSAPNAITTARGSTDAIGLNTAQTNVTWTVNSSGISLNAGGYAGTNTATTGAISVTLNTSGISLNIGAYITTQSNQAFSAEGGSSAFQTIIFTNSNGFSFSNTGGSIWGSYTVPTVTNSSFSVQDSATTINPVNRIAFSTGNNITLSLSTGASSATVGVAHNLAGSSSGTQTTAGTNIVMTHNSSGLNLGVPAFITTAMLSAAGSNFVNTSAGLNLTNISATFNSNSISLSVAAPGGSSWTVSDAITSQTIGRLAFTNANGLTMTLSTSNNGNATVFGSYTVPTQTNQTVGLYALGNTTQNSSTTLDARTLSFNGLGAMTWGYSNGSIQVSAPATSSLSATGAVSIVTNGSTISIGVPLNEWALVGANTAGTTSSAQGSRYNFSGGNNITLSGQSNTIIVSARGLRFSAGTQTDANVTAITFSNSNNVSFGFNQAFGYVTATVTVATSLSNINLSGGTTSSNLSHFKLIDSNGVSWSLDTGSKVYATVKTAYMGLNTAGTNITWTANSSGLSIDAAGYAGTNTAITGGSVTVNSAGVSINIQRFTNSMYEAFPFASASATSTASASNLYLQPFTIYNNLSFGNVNMIGSLSMPATSGGNTLSFRMGVAQTVSLSQFFSVSNDHIVDLFLFSRGSGSFSTELQTFASTRNIFRTQNMGTYFFTAGKSTQTNCTRGISYTFEANVSYPSMTSSTIADGASSYTTWAAGSGSWNSTASTTAATATAVTSNTASVSVVSTYPAATEWSSNKFIQLRFATSLTPGEYWLGVVRSTSSGSATATSATWTSFDTNASYTFSFGASAWQNTAGAQITFAGATNTIANSLAMIGQSAANSLAPLFGLGSFSASWASNSTYNNNAGNPNGAVAFSQLRTQASFFQSWFQLASQRF